MDLFAYIDPGTGSIFIQAVIGSALALGVVLRSYIKRAFYKLKSGLSRQNSVDEEA
jgi:hypothetical protein